MSSVYWTIFTIFKLLDISFCLVWWHDFPLNNDSDIIILCFTPDWFVFVSLTSCSQTCCLISVISCRWVSFLSHKNPIFVLIRKLSLMFWLLIVGLVMLLILIPAVRRSADLSEFWKCVKKRQVRKKYGWKNKINILLRSVGHYKPQIFLFPLKVLNLKCKNLSVQLWEWMHYWFRWLSWLLL